MQQLPAGQVDRYDLALMTDRVAVEQNMPQTYGTQIDCNRETGELELTYGVVDQPNLDKRRAELGLPALSIDLRDARFKFGACVSEDQSGFTTVPPPPSQP